MAIYHCNISNISRAKGSTSCATLSYISGQVVKDERLDTIFSYGRKERVEVTGTIIPDSAPREYQNPVVLFNAIEKYEKTDKARTAKKIEVALPRELTTEQQQSIVEQFIQRNLTAKGYACSYAIHTDKENNNPHAHILVVNRQIDEKGQWSTKCRKEYANDRNEKGECIFNPNLPTDTDHRIPLIDEKTGEQKIDSQNRKQWKRVNVEVNPLDRKETLQELREQWAVECNKYLPKEQQIDHRSYADQGKDKAPTIHEGYGARAMEQRGELSDRCERNREIRVEEETLKRELDENRAFMEVLNETDSRLQDLKSVAADSKTERRYNSAYNAVIFSIERRGNVPALHYAGDELGVLISEFAAPQKALDFLRATKEKWDGFIEKCRESHQNACRDDLGKGEGKQTAEPKKRSESLTERLKGWLADRAREKAERKSAEQEQARKRAEKRAILEKMKVTIQSYDYQARLKQLDFVAEVYRANREASGDRELREKAFEELGCLTGLRTKEYDQRLDFWCSRDSKTVPLAEVERAIKKTKQSIRQEAAEKEKHKAIWEEFKALQEQRQLDQQHDKKKSIKERLQEAEKESQLRNEGQGKTKSRKNHDRDER